MATFKISKIEWSDTCKSRYLSHQAEIDGHRVFFVPFINRNGEKMICMPRAKIDIISGTESRWGLNDLQFEWCPLYGGSGSTIHVPMNLFIEVCKAKPWQGRWKREGDFHGCQRGNTIHG